MAAPKKHDIELLPKEEWERTSIGKFLKWTLSVGRYIVIVTELIVILAFISRFKLDRDLTDLCEEIKQKQNVVEANSRFEQDFRFLQKRLSTIEGLEKERSVPAKVIEKLALIIPTDVIIDKLTVSGNEIGLSATALSDQGLASFLNNLKTSPNFDKLVLSGVTTGSENTIGIRFEIKTEFRPDLNQNI